MADSKLLKDGMAALLARGESSSSHTDELPDEYFARRNVQKKRISDLQMEMQRAADERKAKQFEEKAASYSASHPNGGDTGTTASSRIHPAGSSQYSGLALEV